MYGVMRTMGHGGVGCLVIYAALRVIQRVELVHGMDALVDINERPDSDQRAENIPQPESPRAKIRIHATSPQFISDTVTDTMVPNEVCNTACQPAEQEENPAEMHGVLAIMSRCNQVHLFADVGHLH